MTLLLSAQLSVQVLLPMYPVPPEITMLPEASELIVSQPFRTNVAEESYCMATVTRTGPAVKPEPLIVLSTQALLVRSGTLENATVAAPTSPQLTVHVTVPLWLRLLSVSSVHWMPVL